MKFELRVNGRQFQVDVDPDTPLLWVLRDHLQLTGTKFGCGKGLCGSCTVHLDRRAARACVTPVSAVAESEITTIEGLASRDGSEVQDAWVAEQAPQCGYCQPGMIMATAALLDRHAAPSDEEIDKSITNLCRCGSYPRIRRAIHRAAQARGGAGGGTTRRSEESEEEEGTKRGDA
ncbi:MAG: (2Fe-2S)-binding protein [Myxococcota bacterium]|nr:(2Fe-2S)-binding protein [Myxococcota bacterium]